MHSHVGIVFVRRCRLCRELDAFAFVACDISFCVDPKRNEPHQTKLNQNPNHSDGQCLVKTFFQSLLSLCAEYLRFPKRILATMLKQIRDYVRRIKSFCYKDKTKKPSKHHIVLSDLFFPELNHNNERKTKV